MTELLRVFANRRMAALLALGFASGLPLALTSGTLQAWMKDAGVDLGTIGLFQLVTLPYVLKFLWAPVMDRFVPPFLGRRRGWLLVTQIALIAAIVGLGVVGAGESLRWLGIMALVLAFCSASQDIVADAYRTDVLSPKERGAGASVFVCGYRIAMVASGAGALILIGQNLMTWPTVYVLMAAAMGVGMVGTLIAPEPELPPDAPQSVYEAVVPPFQEFLSRSNGGLVLVFVILFRLPDTVAGTMTIPFLREIGVSNTQIGVIRNAFGVGVTIVGALLGGGVVTKLGLVRSLWLFGILQALSNVGFWILTQTGANIGVLFTVVFVENFCAGLTVAGFFVFLMSQCDARYSATQYALLSSLMAVMGTLIGSQTGIWAKALGWPGFFLLSIAAAVPGMTLLPWMRDQPATPRHAERRGFEVLTES